MNPFSRIFSRRPELTPNQAARLAAWHNQPAVDLQQPFDEARFVVVDVETTGLNLARDRLIAIGAIAVVESRAVLSDSFEIVLQQKTVSDRDNILIHGIGGTAQREGVPPVEALLRFLEYLGKTPLVAFHVTFDETMIRRALKEYLGLNFKHPWRDLAYLMPGLHPLLARKLRTLDNWTEHFHIQNYARHNALADALSTAQLYQVALENARQQGIETYQALQSLEKAQRWLNWAN